jgi:exonuclease III
MPADLDVYAPERWRDDALFRPEVRMAYKNLLAQGWMDALRLQRCAVADFSPAAQSGDHRRADRA